MDGLFDWIIETATWAKDDQGTFLAWFGIFCTILGLLLWRFFRTYDEAVKVHGQLKTEKDTLSRALTSANKRLDEVDPARVLKMIREAEAAKDKRALLKLSEDYFRHQRGIQPVFARVLARARLQELTEDREAALADAERYLILGQAEQYLVLGEAADPQDPKTAALLEDIRARRLAFASGGDAQALLTGSANDLDALRKAYNSLKAQGRYALAIVLAERALDLVVSRFGAGSLGAAAEYHELGALHRQQGQYEDADRLLSLALEIRQKEAPASEELSSTMNSLGLVRRLLGRLEEAEGLSRQAIEIGKATVGEGHPSYAACLNTLAQLLCETGRLEEAERLYRQAIEITKATIGEGHPAYAIRLNNLALLLRDMGRLDEAEPLFRQAIEIDKATIGEEHPEYATRLNNLALLMKDLGRFEEARPLYAQAIKIDLDRLGAEHPQSKRDARNYAILLRQHFPDDPALAELEATFGPDIGKG